VAELPAGKPVEWRGSSHDDMLAQRKAIQYRLGYQLRRVQLGLLPNNYRPMNIVGSGVYEIRVKDEDGIARLMYVAKFGDVVNVLHVFTKKAEQTPKTDIDLAQKRYKEASGG
jgi:phage-related protein